MYSNVFVFFLPSLLIVISDLLGIFTDASIWLITDFVSNASWIIYLTAILLFLIELGIEKDQVNARVLLTYIPMVLMSQKSQIWLGVDAIRSIDPSWDEHRGPLYPSLWYKMFSLYDPP